MKKDNSQIKARFFDSSDPIAIIRFIATFQLASKINNNHEGASMWNLPFFVQNTFCNDIQQTFVCCCLQQPICPPNEHYKTTAPNKLPGTIFISRSLTSKDVGKQVKDS